MRKRGLIINGGSGDSATLRSYIDLEDRPDDAIDTTVVPTTTGGEFTPNNASLVEGKVWQREG